MTETTNVSAGALAALAAAAGKSAPVGGAATEGAKKRTVSPQAQAALEAHRLRAQLAVAVLEELEEKRQDIVEQLIVDAKARLVRQAAEREAAEAERKANLQPRGAALEAYRAKTNQALALLQSLQDKGINIDDLLAKAAAADTGEAPQG